MKCNNCGTENTDDSLFCIACGSSLTNAEVPAESAEPVEIPVTEAVTDDATETVTVAETAPEAPVAEVVPEAPVAEASVDEAPVETAEEAQPAQKKSMTKWFIIGGIALAAVILLIIILVVCLSGGKYIEKETSIRLIVDEDGKTVIINNGEALEKKIDGTYSMQYSNLKGDVSTFLADGTLYCVDDDEVNKVADDVQTYTLAADGTAVAFVDTEGDLYYVNLSSGKKTSIDEETSLFVMSPDGKYVSYVVRDYMESSSAAYVFNGSKSVEVVSDLSVSAVVLGISNDCEYIYINDRNDENESELIVYTDGGKNRNKVSNKFAELLYFNCDNTQIMFASDKGDSYVSVEGEEAVKVSGEKVRIILPENVTMSSYTYGINDLAGNAYYIYNEDGYCIYYINDDFEGSKIASNVGGSVKITNDGKYVYYMDESDNLYMIKADEDAEEEKILSNVDSFDILAEADKIYFTSNGDLYCYHGGSKVKEIKEDVTQFAVSGDDICFFMSEDNLYVSKNGKSFTKIVGNAEGFFCDAYSAFYVIEKSGSYQMYGSDGSDDFELVSKAVAMD